MSAFAEKQTEWIIDNNLVNKGWRIDGNESLKNVFYQKSPYKEHQKKLKGKRPDYILYQTGTQNPIAIIEAKKSGIDLQPALEQGTEYAQALNVPLVFAMNGSYCETRFVPNGKSLILNGNEVRELLREVEVLKFLEEKTNDVYTIPKEVVVSREDLIRIFKSLNNTLRSEGLRAGIERFSEFSNILFLKLLSENNKKSWWGSIKTQSNEDIIGYINGHVIRQIQNAYGGDVFTPLLIKNPQTLRNIIDSLDPLILSTIETDIKGDAFEYFLEKTTSTENDLGEYFTPRHVIKTIVNLTAPKFGEKIYDPFCGTGGFLVDAYNYLKDNTLIETEEHRKQLCQNSIFGREITNSARIAKMNMVLHGDGHSGVEQINSLSNPIDNKFDVIVTNIPFSQKTEYGNNYYDGLAKTNGDSVCVLHALRSLKPGGRMAIVVPEGFLFRKDAKNVREFLLSKAKLQSVISLPQGIFLPYTGVKTDILYFTNAHQSNTSKNYWYFEVKKDGYSLDAHRRPLKGQNDLQKIESSDIKRAEKDDHYRENVMSIGFETISLEEVKKNNYNLVGSVYRKITKKSGIALTPLNEIVKFIRGFSYRSDMIVDDGISLYNLKSIKKDMRCQYDFKFINKEMVLTAHERYYCQPGDLLMAITDLTPTSDIIGRTTIAYERGLFSMDLVKLEIEKTKIIPKYLHYICNSEEFLNEAKKFSTGNNVKHLNLSNVLTIHIPVPNLKIQELIVKKIEKQQQTQIELENKAHEIKEKIHKSINNIWEKSPDNENPNHLEDFNELIKKASKPLKPPQT